MFLTFPANGKRHIYIGLPKRVTSDWNPRPDRQTHPRTPAWKKGDQVIRYLGAKFFSNGDLPAWWKNDA